MILILNKNKMRSNKIIHFALIHITISAPGLSKGAESFARAGAAVCLFVFNVTHRNATQKSGSSNVAVRRRVAQKRAILYKNRELPTQDQRLKASKSSPSNCATLASAAAKVALVRRLIESQRDISARSTGGLAKDSCSCLGHMLIGLRDLEAR